MKISTINPTKLNQRYLYVLYISFVPLFIHGLRYAWIGSPYILIMSALITFVVLYPVHVRKPHATKAIKVWSFLSKRHDPINFNCLVTVTYEGKPYKSQFKATITHMEQGLAISCLISARGQFLVSETGLGS